MQIWIIRDGEKHGPISDFDVRRGIEDGDYGVDTPAWHEGLPQWSQLGEISIFRSHFPAQPITREDTRTAAKPEPETEPKSAPPANDTPPPLPPSGRPRPAAPSTQSTSENIQLLRRFWARWTDLHLYFAVLWLFLYLANADIGALVQSLAFLVLQFVPWLFIEAALLRHHGTTPGKWLLGIHVRNDDGSPLNNRQATTRTMRVLIVGIGLGWSFISPICQGISFAITRHLGRPLWDHLGGHQVHFVAIRGTRYLAAIAAIYISLQLQIAVLAPYMIPVYQEQMPILREYFEKNPPPHFPERRPTPER